MNYNIVIAAILIVGLIVLSLILLLGWYDTYVGYGVSWANKQFYRHKIGPAILTGTNTLARLRAKLAS